MTFCFHFFIKNFSEKSAVESDYVSMTKDSQRRASEATAKQRTIDTLNHTIRNLANQRVEAERRLGDYSREKDTLENVLNEIKSHVVNERQKVEEMRIKINCQQASTKVCFLICDVLERFILSYHS